MSDKENKTSSSSITQKSEYVIKKEDYFFDTGIESGNPSVIIIPKDRRPPKK